MSVERWVRRLLAVPAALMLGLLVLPPVLLFVAPLGSAEAAEPSPWPALRVSGLTSAISLGFIILAGTPLAWWLSRGRGLGRAVVAALGLAPLVLPPSVAGLALLVTFGASGPFAELLRATGTTIVFTPAAVVIAQVFVAAPLYVAMAATAFARVEVHLLEAARTLGCSSVEAFRRVALPIAMPGVCAGAAVAWARAIGEFGATLFFAGNLPGRTQTLPLAVYSALEGDVAHARRLAALLVVTALVALMSGAAAWWLLRGRSGDRARDGDAAASG